MFSKHGQFTPPSPAVEQRIDDILARLSLEDKLDLIGGVNEGTKAKPQAGIPQIKFADGPLGVHWWCKSSTAYPALIGLAAAFDHALAYRAGAAIGRDCRARGVHAILAPGVNIYRSPLCGRNYEYLGEDPCVAAQIVTQWIRGCQDQGVATTVKHFAVNFQEYDRHNVSSDVDERTLREVYLPAFEAAVRDAGAGAVMTAYNLVNGVHCSEHAHLIRTILKGEWGFTGVVMSDWVSTYDGVAAANAGLDLEMPTGAHMNAGQLLPAIGDGRVSVATMDDKIRRLLRLMICFGWLDHEQQDASIPLADEQTAAVALDMARGGCVLLRNEDTLLPFDRVRIKTLAVIGPTAHPAVIGAGGSAYTTPWRSVSIRDGIAALAGDTRVEYCQGVNPYRTDEVFSVAAFATEGGAPGVLAEYFNNRDVAGTPVVTQVEQRIDHPWYTTPLPDGVERNAFSVRWTGVITPVTSGRHYFYQTASDGRVRAWLDDEVLFDGWDDMASVPGSMTRELEAGRSYRLRVEYGQLRGWNVMRVGWEHEALVLRDWQAAVQAARAAAAVVFCGGFTERSEGEGYDRSFGMPALLEQLLGEVAAVNPNTVVVLTAGGNVDMRNWLDKVKGVLHAWYPGQEGGQAVAEILFGTVNPSGKLPATFEKQIEDRSSFACYHDDDKDKRVALTDGIFCGYRQVDKAGVTPQFPFGFGLSYTTFAYENMRVSAKTIRPGQPLTVTCEVVNTGTRAGAEVVQLYVRDVRCTVPRPIKELKGFAKMHVAAGARATAVIELDERAFRFYHPEQGWTIEPGAFELQLGASVQDIRLCARVTMKI